MTETQILLALEMLDVPAGSNLYRTDDLGLNVTQFKALNGPVDAPTAIRATISTLSTEQDAICQDVINDFKDLMKKSLGVSIVSGGIQSVPGLEIDFDKRIAGLKQRLKTHLPFYRDWSTMVQRNAQQDIAMASVIM